MRGSSRDSESAVDSLDDDDPISPGVGSYWLAAFAGCAVVAFALVLGLSALWQHWERQDAATYLRATGERLSAELALRAAAVRGQVGRLRRDPGIQAALADGRPAVLRAKEDQLTAVIPGALDISLFRARDVGPGGEAGQRLSYAGMDMVRAVLTDSTVAPLEAHRVRREDEHLASAGAILGPDGQRAIGVIHVKLPMSMLPRVGVAAAGDPVYLFEQKVGDDIVPIQSDAPHAPDRAPDFQEPVPGTRIELSAWSEASGLFAPGRLPWLGGVLAATLLALGLVLWLGHRGLARALRADLDAVVVTVADAAEKRPPREIHSRLVEFHAVQEQIRGLLRALQPARPAPRRPAVDVAPLAGGPVSGALHEPQLDGDLDLDSALDFPAGDPETAGAPKAAAEASVVTEPGVAGPGVADAIFRAYDIRGLVEEQIDATVMHRLGQALGSEALERNSHLVIVGRDQRPSGERLARALVEGLLSTGVDVIDLGMVPTPLVYFACSLRADASGAMVTASHNPAAYNGLKVVLAGLAATAADIDSLRRRVHAGDVRTGAGNCRDESIVDTYIEAVEQDVAIARVMTVVIDCGHATAGLVAPALFRALGCKVIELDCDCDPALADERMPDPAQPRHLHSVGDAVQSAGADLGIAFDADGDRLGVVDARGHVIAADRVLMLLAADVLARHPGSDIVYDVKSSHHLGAQILRHGGRPVMWKSGHTHLKEKLRETGAPLAGEFTGHFMFAERWNGFDDAFYAAGRLLEVLALDPRSTDEVFAELPAGLGTAELFVPLSPEESASVMEKVLGMADRLDGVEVNTIDGLRAEFDQGWGLVRSSNTQNGVVFRFQADDQESLDKIQDLFRRMMHLAAPQLALPF